MSVLLRRFEYQGKQFEAMLEKSGKWRGMVHVFDLEIRKASNTTIANQDVVITGARFDFDTYELTVTRDDVAGEIDWRLAELVRTHLTLGLVN